jgi:hypothetical protein
VPIWVSAGQLVTSVAVQGGVASGLEIRPGGRSTRMFLTLPSGIPPVLLNLKLVMPTNGWAPAWVSGVVRSLFRTVAEKLASVTPKAA